MVNSIQSLTAFIDNSDLVSHFGCIEVNSEMRAQLGGEDVEFVAMDSPQGVRVSRGVLMELRN